MRFACLNQFHLLLHSWLGWRPRYVWNKSRGMASSLWRRRPNTPGLKQGTLSLVWQAATNGIPQVVKRRQTIFLSIIVFKCSVCLIFFRSPWAVASLIWSCTDFMYRRLAKHLKRPSLQQLRCVSHITKKKLQRQQGLFCLVLPTVTTNVLTSMVVFRFVNQTNSGNLPLIVRFAKVSFQIWSTSVDEFPLVVPSS